MTEIASIWTSIVYVINNRKIFVLDNYNFNMKCRLSCRASPTTAQQENLVSTCIFWNLHEFMLQFLKKSSYRRRKNLCFHENHENWQFSKLHIFLTTWPRYIPEKWIVKRKSRITNFKRYVWYSILDRKSKPTHTCTRPISWSAVLRAAV